MPPNKRARKKTYRQMRIEAEAAARRQRHRRRRLLSVVVLAGAVLGLTIFLVVTGGDDGEDVATEGTTTTAAPALESAAGKPCVPVVDVLPAGAPAVPVVPGPPPTQLLVQDLKEGTGAAVMPTSTVTAHYIGVACSTGKIFDSSYRGGAPVPFPLANVIEGWQQGLVGMKVGGQRLLGIPSNLAYKSTGFPPNIAPDEALWFVVEITEVK